MTPLANRIVKDMTRRAAKRQFVDRCNLLKDLSDIHCFEGSEVVEVMEGLVGTALDSGGVAGLRSIATGDMSFLPAPKTWLEWGDGRERVGVLLIERDGWAEAAVAGYTPDRFDGFSSWPWRWDIPLGALGASADSRLILPPDLSPDDQRTSIIRQMSIFVSIFLTLINTPKVIGRQQHMPNASLERRLLKRRRDIGRFPLHAWTEIKLQIHAPANLSDDEPVEAHLTGQRALHFCRAHLRVKNGRVEFVRSHWRGDASLGIKRSRYTVTQ